MKPIRRWLASIATALTGGAAIAHDGHGLNGAHWHATDSWGWVALAVVLGAAIWAARRK